MEPLLRQPTADADARVAASIDHWKRKLLDLSKRNRLLNFKVNKKPARVSRRDQGVSAGTSV